MSTGLIEEGRTKARQVAVDQRDDTGRVTLGMLSLTSLFKGQSWWSGKQDVDFGSVLMLAQERASVDQLRDWWWASSDNDLGVWASQIEDESALARLRSFSDHVVAVALAEFADTGVWRRAGDVLHQTDLGYEWALLLVSLKDRGMLDDEDFDDEDFED